MARHPSRGDLAGERPCPWGNPGARESGRGLTVGLNFAAYGDSVRLRSTSESPTAPNAFAYPTHCRTTGSCLHDYSVGEAWNLLARANRLGNRTTIASPRRTTPS